MCELNAKDANKVCKSLFYWLVIKSKIIAVIVVCYLLLKQDLGVVLYQTKYDRN